MNNYAHSSGFCFSSDSSSVHYKYSEATKEALENNLRNFLRIRKRLLKKKLDFVFFYPYIKPVDVNDVSRITNTTLGERTQLLIGESSG